MPHHDRGFADQLDHPRKDAGKAHSKTSLSRRTLDLTTHDLAQEGRGWNPPMHDSKERRCWRYHPDDNHNSKRREAVTLGLAQEMLRLLGAAVVGAIIGINRDIAGKPIGLRTLALVALAAAIVTIAAIEVPGIGGSADALSRVIQGVIQGIMTGISFIGAGVVLRDTKSRTVEGLTTASTVWIAAALGIACGLGAWTVAVTGTILALVFLVLFEWLEVRFSIGKAKKEE
jgi:putative Mg2+ transporter-C (MgtC) family protein